MPKSRRMLIEISYNETPVITKEIVEKVLMSEMHFSNVAYEVRVTDDTGIVEAIAQVEALKEFAARYFSAVEGLEFAVSDVERFIKAQDFDEMGVTAYVREQYNRRLKESFGMCNWCGGHVFITTRYKDGVAQDPEVVVDHDMFCVFKE